MKMTKKLKAAFTVSRELYFYGSHGEVYAELERRGYWWDAKAGEWTNRKQPSNSVFKSDDDEPTGVIKVRIMAHPDDLPKAIQHIKSTNLKIAEVSKPYPNRKGSGVRVYIDAVIPRR